MDTSKLILLVHTLKYLRFRQIYYQLYYRIRNRFFRRAYTKPLQTEVVPLQWKNTILYTDSYKNGLTFDFLHISHSFTAEIDWNHNAFGKLWTYNLNYFDFLNQSAMTLEEGVALIQDYIKEDSVLNDGKEPYPISLRGINWVKFLSNHSISNPEINQTLYNHYYTLFKNLEYHLLGNHLLENGFSLFFGAHYFKDEMLYTKAKQILMEELNGQILEDGAHFELSPMYHQILLHRLLDCINLFRLNSWKKDSLGSFLEEKALKMLSWLQEATFSNGNIPMVNDSAYGIAPTSKQLFDYAKNLGLEWPKGKLSDSGYRKFTRPKYELFIDVGNIGPTYQPGHAHSDTFSFELYVGGNPVMVDTGVSTYEKNQKRQSERATAAHNTVQLGIEEQSQIWGGFRVAKRAKIIDVKENETQVEAVHDGYKGFGVLHTRRFSANASEIFITDTLNKETKEVQRAFFHFHPSIEIMEVTKSKVHLDHSNISLDFGDSAARIEIQEYDYALGFNKTRKAQKIAVSFHRTLQTQILL